MEPVSDEVSMREQGQRRLHARTGIALIDLIRAYIVFLVYTLTEIRTRS